MIPNLGVREPHVRICDTAGKYVKICQLIPPICCIVARRHTQKQLKVHVAGIHISAYNKLGDFVVWDSIPVENTFDQITCISSP